MANVKEDPRYKVISFRVSEKEFQSIKGRAELYAGGSMPDWIRNCVFNYGWRPKKKASKEAS